MSAEEALSKLQAILGKGLYPTAISEVREVLVKLKKDHTQTSGGLPNRGTQANS